MSRGPGRCQRRILEVLSRVPERRLSRVKLEEALVAGEGFGASNLLRSIRGLERLHLVVLRDERHKVDAVVSLPRPVKVLSEDEIGRLLTEMNEEARR